MNQLHWFRNDLRLSDHEILSNLLEIKELIPIYIIDPRNWEMQDIGFRKTGKFRTKFLFETLENLDRNLKKLGSKLIVKKGNPEKLIPELINKYNVDILSYELENTSEEKNIEDNVLENLDNKVEVKTFWSKTLIHRDDLSFPIQNLPDIFTQFRKIVEQDLKVRTLFHYPETLPINPVDETSDIKSEFGNLLDLNIYEPRAAHQFVGGERYAKRELDYYFWKSKSLSEYKKTRNGLIGRNYSSKFSAWLANGSISPREIYFEVLKYEQEIEKNETTYWLIFELLWRDYFRFVSLKFDYKIFQKWGLKDDSVNIKNKFNLDKLELWIDGMTQKDFVDANMIEISKTGFMSNRGRQNVASYLVKDMGLDWRLGAKYFESQLIDYDVASNWCNWLYVAGLGNDPRENRYFNISRQQQMYDPKGDFVRLWLNK